VSIFIGKETRLVVQGITGRDGSFHSRQMMEYGTNVVAGVTPGKGGQTFEGEVPVFNTVAEAVEETGANTSVIYVPATLAAGALYEAADAGIALIVNSAFRSDAEQAALFAAHPDPTWVAPPGHSLHRCATELDLGPESAYGWLAANAGRFGFVQRYSWEAWHYGFTAGPPPCSTAGNEVGAGGGGDGALAGASLPAFVPAEFRVPIVRAATHWNVSPALLAGQLMAESGFDPYAGSPAGAQGIAQFIPSTASSYGLRDPFDPAEAIDAEAHLMSDLLRRFGSPQLALAAYNAGPAPVEACHCVPAIPETQAYVSRILALLGGAGALAVPSFEVRLVA